VGNTLKIPGSNFASSVVGNQQNPESDYMYNRYTTAYLRPFAIIILLCFIIIPLLLGCGPKQDAASFTSPPGYNLNRPIVYKLPAFMDEISGITYNPKDNSVLAINDEVGWLFKVHLKDDLDIQKWQYTKGADFEDLVRIDSMFYVLVSTGDIIRFRFFTPDSAKVDKFEFPIPGKNEFEILYHDKSKKQLVLLCKDCEADDKNSLTAYAFDLDSNAYKAAPTYVIDIRKIEELMDEKKLRFKPSAATINPLTNELYIISSINKVLVVSNLGGIPSAVYKINPKLYKQPEGIAFTPKGDLLISNESADIGAANILLFKRR
jgi:DNA-binding beta-propeller fold protein YncE